MFIKLYKKWKKKVADNKEREKKILASQKAKLLEDLVKLRTKMTSKPCAIHNFINCDSECVHFYKGTIFLMPPIPIGTGCPARYTIKPPRCKLWS